MQPSGGCSDQVYMKKRRKRKKLFFLCHDVAGAIQVRAKIEQRKGMDQTGTTDQETQKKKQIKEKMRKG